MKQKPFMQRIGDFMEGKGFYIVLFLCVTAIGISGYFLFSGLMPSEPVSLDEPTTQVAGKTPQVEVPPQTPNLVKPPEEATEPTEPAATTPTAEEGATTETQDEASASQATVFTWPVRGTIGRDYSLEVFAYDSTMGDWRTHSGMDINADLGTEVMAVTAGTVSAISSDPLMGTMVVIDHGAGLQSVYANLGELPTVSVGDQVNPGTVIGAIGTTAIAESAGPTHLHFEMMQDGVAVDPIQFLPDGN